MSNFITLECNYEHCTNTVHKKKYLHDAQLRSGRSGNAFCSRTCLGSSRKKQPETFKCLGCPEVVSRVRTNKDTLKFCSTQCGARYNAKLRIKSCSQCANPRVPKSKLCVPCKEAYIREKSMSRSTRSRRHNLDHMTLEQVKDIHGDQFHAKIRGDSRSAYLSSGRPLECLLCAYRKHLDVCHIKAVKDFDSSSLVGDVNALNNLVALCKNHHWEFDHGTLGPEERALIK